MNKVILHGFTGKDPEVKTVGENKVAKFSLATTSFRKDKDGNKITDWHNLVFWDRATLKLADLCEKHVKKGTELIVEGEISYRDYTDKDGVKKYFTEIIGHSLEFCGKKETTSTEITAKDQYQGKKSTGAMSNIKDLPGTEEDDSNLPF
jgi:single-strand DNA-binding protein